MIKKIFILSAISLIMYAHSATADVLFYDGMNNGNWIGDIKHWRFHPRIAAHGSTSVAYVASGSGGYASRAGTGMYRFNKINGDDRSELILSYATNPNIVNLTNLQEYWFGWSILLPTNWPTNWPSSGGPNGGWTDQWHVADSENCPNWSATRQPITFEVERVSVGNYRFKVIPAYNNTYCTGGWSSNGTYYSPTFSLGSWVDIIIHVKPSYVVGSSSGILEIWARVNGTLTKFVNLHNVRIGHDMPKGMSPYIGQYLGVDADDGTPCTTYWDEFRVGDENSSFDEVDPAQGTAPTPDTTPPVMSNFTVNGQPNGSTFAAGTNNLTIAAVSSETCHARKGTVLDQDYDDMTDNFSSTDSTSHSDSWTCADGSFCTAYVRCEDPSGNESIQYTVTAQVSSAGTGFTNLLNSNTYDATQSYDLSTENAAHAWDGCVENLGTCISESTDGGQLLHVHNLGQCYSLTGFNIFADLVPVRIGDSFSFSIKQNEGDSWTDIFDHEALSSSQWYNYTTEVNGQVARWIKIEVFNSQGTIIQVREYTAYGTPTACNSEPPPPVSPASNLRPISGTAGTILVPKSGKP